MHRLLKMQCLTDTVPEGKETSARSSFEMLSGPCNEAWKKRLSAPARFFLEPRLHVVVVALVPHQQRGR